MPMFKSDDLRAQFARLKSISGLLGMRGKSNAFGIVHPNKDITAVHAAARMIFTDGQKHLDGNFTRQSFYDLLELAARGHTRPLREQLQAILDTRPDDVAAAAAITAIMNISPPKVVDGERDEENGAAAQPNGVDAQNYHSHIHTLFGESEITEQQNWAQRPIAGRNGFLKNFFEAVMKPDTFTGLSISSDFAQAPAENIYLAPQNIASLQDLLDIANDQAETSLEELEARDEKEVLVELAKSLKAGIDANNGQVRLVILQRPDSFFPLSIEMHLPQDGVDLGGRWFRAAGFGGIEGKEPPATKEPIKTISEVVMAGGTNSYKAFTPIA
ncbi:MAG: hypothetical protein GC136_01515 [Alphaproteobacteria bacterium]|nr:hypothetical protein [Alphaproteobacteria bacterium]